MPRFEPIDAARCKTHGWRPNTNYAFASGDAIAPVVADEIVHVLAQLPVAFRRVSEDKSAYEVVAVQSLEQNRNLLVHPDGRWMGSYIPVRRLEAT